MPTVDELSEKQYQKKLKRAIRKGQKESMRDVKRAMKYYEKIDKYMTKLKKEGWETE